MRLLLAILFCFFLNITSSHAGSTSFTTYYPAPTGNYEKMHVNNSVGVGTFTNSAAKVTVYGKITTNQFQVVPNAGANKILVSDASGNLTLQNRSSIDWDFDSGWVVTCPLDCYSNVTLTIPHTLGTYPRDMQIWFKPNPGGVVAYGGDEVYPVSYGQRGAVGGNPYGIAVTSTNVYLHFWHPPNSAETILYEHWKTTDSPVTNGDLCLMMQYPTSPNCAAGGNTPAMDVVMQQLKNNGHVLANNYVNPNYDHLSTNFNTWWATMGYAEDDRSELEKGLRQSSWTRFFFAGSFRVLMRK